MGLPNEIQVGRYNRFVQKLLSIKGKATLFAASPELDFVIPLFYGAENRYLEGWDRFGNSTAIPAAGAGNIGGFRIRNPVGSNVVAVIEKVLVADAAAAVVAVLLQVGAATTDLVGNQTLTGSGFRLDPRGRPNATCILSSSTAAAAATTLGTSIAEVAFAGIGNYDLIYTDNQELQLLPGDAYQLITSSANVAFVGSWLWRERFLEDSERA